MVAQALAPKLLQSLKAGRGAGFYLVCWNKDCSLFGEIDISNLTSPIVKVAKQEMVDALIVVKVKAPLNRLLIQKGDLPKNNSGFHLRQLSLIPDVQLADTSIAQEQYRYKTKVFQGACKSGNNYLAVNKEKPRRGN